MKYSVDTSSLLTGWMDYPLNNFSGLWGNIDDLIESGEFVATQEVLVEIRKKDDNLFKWARERKKMFVPIDVEIQNAVRSILKSYPRLIDTVKGRSTVDPWVIALAQVNKCTVVNQERHSIKKEIVRIPDVCRGLNIRSINLLQMIREEGWKF